MDDESTIERCHWKGIPFNSLVWREHPYRVSHWVSGAFVSQLSLFFRLLDSFSESYLNGVGSILGHSNALVYACHVCKALSRMLRHGMVRYCRMIMCVCMWYYDSFFGILVVPCLCCKPTSRYILYIYIYMHVCNYSSYVLRLYEPYGNLRRLGLTRYQAPDVFWLQVPGRAINKSKGVPYPCSSLWQGRPASPLDSLLWYPCGECVFSFSFKGT